MALSTRPRKDEDEEILEEDAEETEVGTTAPAISDRRRRRMLAQGLDPDAAPTSVAREEKRKRDDGEEKRKREDGGEGNFISRFFNGIRDYFLDVRAELKKVAWPTREETERLTRIVLAVTALFAVVLGAVSFVFGWLTTQIAVKDWGTVAGLVTIAIIIVVSVLWLIRDRLFPNYE